MVQKFGPDNYIVLDLEMTGLSPKVDKVIEIGAVRVREGRQGETYSTFVNPYMPIPEKVIRLTGITDEMVCEKGISQDEAIQALLEFIGEDVIVGHNIVFDYSFLKQWAVNKKRPLELMACDTLKIARVLLPEVESKTLESLCAHYHIERRQAHRALDDTVETGILFEKLKEELATRIEDGKTSVDTGEKLFTPKILQYKAKRQTPVTAHQLKQLREYRQAHGINDVINWEILTRNEASRIMDKYYATYGR